MIEQFSNQIVNNTNTNTNSSTNHSNNVTNTNSNNVSNVTNNNIIHINNFNAKPPEMDPNEVLKFIEENEVDQYTGEPLNILEGAIRKIIEKQYIDNPAFRNIYCNNTSDHAKTYLCVNNHIWKPIHKAMAHAQLLDMSLMEIKNANDKMGDYFNDPNYQIEDHNGKIQQFMKTVDRLYYQKRPQDVEEAKRYQRLAEEVLMENHEVVNNNYKKIIINSVVTI